MTGDKLLIFEHGRGQHGLKVWIMSQARTSVTEDID